MCNIVHKTENSAYKKDITQNTMSHIGFRRDQKGVKIINDQVHDNGKFFSQDEFEHTFYIKKTNFVQYLGLKASSHMSASVRRSLAHRVNL